MKFPFLYNPPTGTPPVAAAASFAYSPKPAT